MGTNPFEAAVGAIADTPVQLELDGRIREDDRAAVQDQTRNAKEAGQEHSNGFLIPLDGEREVLEVGVRLGESGRDKSVKDRMKQFRTLGTESGVCFEHNTNSIVSARGVDEELGESARDFDGIGIGVGVVGNGDRSLGFRIFIAPVGVNQTVTDISPPLEHAFDALGCGKRRDDLVPAPVSNESIGGIRSESGSKSVHIRDPIPGGGSGGNGGSIRGIGSSSRSGGSSGSLGSGRRNWGNGHNRRTIQGLNPGVTEAGVRGTGGKVTKIIVGDNPLGWVIGIGFGANG